MSIRILVVDDNPDILANVRDFLSMKDGWAPETASTGLEALERIDRSTFDLVILDVGLPDTDGMTLTRRLRASGFTAPILMLTARDTIDDRVEGLTSGADDYLIKPFSLRELAARVEALLRRSGANPAGHLTAGPLSLDLKTLRVEREGRDIRLNPTCLQLLRELMQQSPGIVSRRRLEAVLWQGEPLVLTRDQLGFEDTERVFRRITLFSVLAVFFLGLLAGWILARNIMKPVKTLSDEVRKASAARTYEPLSVELTNDEVGELARICDGAMKRLHEALQREKAFTGDVSHELRTPLTVIETSAELLSMTPLSPAQAKQVERITRSAGDMRELMSLFLSFARLSNETTGPEPDSAAGILKAVADTWEPFAAEKGLALVLRREAECPGAYSPVMLGTVANNLVKNAVAYTESGVVTITETSEGFIVSDSGPGLAGDEAARIFEHGVRGSAAVADGSGAGLGLSIVSRICRRSGWTVTAGKAPEGGAAFTVTMTKAVDARRADRL